MRHKMSGRKLQRKTGHRNAMLRNMAAALIKHEQIKTTTPKARELRPYVEKLITLAKRGGLSNRRLAHSRLMDDAQEKKLFEVLAERYADRNGGYTRIIKIGNRLGDNAPVCRIELVEELEASMAKVREAKPETTEIENKASESTPAPPSAEGTGDAAPAADAATEQA